ncbi:MAG TPA: BBP7 family outer membrane beta-barrel protein [Planctomicrobium sp.]|nr:BBP7 family outer membrane beta-barrel protein [Planctomicrobium sp.]
MKFWTTGIFVALGALLPTLALGQNQWDAPGLPPANYFEPSYSNGYPGGGYPGGGYSGGYEQLLPERNDQYGGDSLRRLTIREAFAESYVRLDYMHWKINGGDGALLGAPVAPSTLGAPPPDLSGRNRNNRLQATNAITGLQPQTFVVVPTLENEFDSVNGLRGTFGIPTLAGTLETEIFYFEQVDNVITINPFLDNQSPASASTIIAGTTLFINGALSPDRMILYNDGYQAIQKTSFWGTEANWIFNPFTPNVPTEISPILGFRYIALHDDLSIRGRDIQSPTLTLNHMIESMTRNHIFGPQIGLRAQSYLGPRFELGAEVKFIAGINSMDESVNTSEIFNPTTSADPNQTLEPNRSFNNHRTRFAPVFDLALTGKLQVSPHFKLFASYEFLLGTGFSRAFDNINYDSPPSATSAPTIRLKSDLQEFMAHGFAVGGEFVFR